VLFQVRAVTHNHPSSTPTPSRRSRVGTCLLTHWDARTYLLLAYPRTHSQCAVLVFVYFTHLLTFTDLPSYALAVRRPRLRLLYALTYFY
jgi:hypothetical protein